jgi:transcriptional regulator with XRE-family HTH domain
VNLDEGLGVGARIRQVRLWRGRSLTALAELAGISPSYLSLLERGRRPIDKRSLIEAIAEALHVAPSELLAEPFPPRDTVAASARAAAGLIEAVIADVRLGDAVDVAARPWPIIAADLHRLNTELRPHADYAAQGELLPSLIEELHALHATHTHHRTDALRGLATCYHTSAMLVGNMGNRGLAQLAADRQITVAERMSRPEWIAHAEWVRAQTMGGSSRRRQIASVLRSLAAVADEPMTPELAQAIGQLHLSVALAYAAKDDEESAWLHFREAEALADRQAAEVGQFGCMWFGRPNVQIWKVALGAELGYGGRVAEFARDARPEVLPSPVRHAAFYADLGRSLARERRTTDEAVRVLRKAEDLAPQHVRNMPFVRETVTALMSRARRDATGRELRGLAHRMGMAS